MVVEAGAAADANPTSKVGSWQPAMAMPV